MKQRRRASDVHAEAGHPMLGLRPGLRNSLRPSQAADGLTEQIERTLAHNRTKVEHPFREIQRQSGQAQVCYLCLAKNQAQLDAQGTQATLTSTPQRLPFRPSLGSGIGLGDTGASRKSHSHKIASHRIIHS